MKTLFRLTCILLTGFFVLADLSISFANTPQGINYQAVARDSDGNPVTNANLNVRFSVLSGGAAGTLVWQETHTTNANSLGLFNLVIGSGNKTGGSAATFSILNWGADEHHIKVEVDFGSGYVDMGTSQFMSVPYALSAETVATLPSMGLNDLTNVNTSGVSNGDILQFNGTNWVPGTVSGGASLWNETGSNIYYSAGNVGIGVNNPLNPINIVTPNNLIESSPGIVNVSNAAIKIRLEDNDIGSINGIAFSNSTATNLSGAAILHERTGLNSQGKLHFATKESSGAAHSVPIRMTISELGYVGIGTTEPEAQFHILQTSAGEALPNGAIFQRNNSQWKLYNSGIHFSFAENNVRLAYIAGGTGNYVQPSDRYLKTNISQIGKITSDIMKLEPVTYKYIASGENAPITYGFIAQDVANIFPDLVQYDEQDNPGLSYGSFSVLAIKAIQEQQAIIDTQAKKLEQFEQILINAEFEIE